MKYFIRVLFFLFFLFFYENVFSFDKIAIVNINNVFDNLSKFYGIEKILNKEFNQRAISLQEQELKLQYKINAFQRNKLTMQPNMIKKIEKEINNEHNKFLLKAKNFEEDNKSRQLEERNKILRKIKDIVSKIAIIKGYNLIIDSNVVIYSSNIKNITDEILKQIK
ncbi:OmpH family outer membrane protein [Candidatus Purcelliella pentastirinorum]|uniref:Chaperone protein Skp n=1 Tax=Candidatus Purcelliella pentastirinorum TaxID=472834 RepID=A0AAX3N8B8_9ENTR|nr:OmpH family outer membrane protein [Candidatus Purcelliella pentastirinorum]WDI78686.1 OmpH family outer membrane protein [Candidatus Purcelliella pentastirinorum]WDR80702.1 OmpH family outer membrane protein [Candidatus Purcelliella pentastirinorum]